MVSARLCMGFASAPVGGSFLARKAAWALSGCLLAEIATIACSLMNISMVKVTNLLTEAESTLGFNFGVRAHRNEDMLH